MKKVIFFVFVMVATLAILIVGVFFYYSKTVTKQVSLSVEQSKLTDAELKDKIGQMIMVGFRGTEAKEDSDIFKIIKDVKIGGVMLFDFDVPSKSSSKNIESPKQVKELISDIQKYSEVSIFVAIDAEGGNVNRLKEKYGFSSIISAEKMGKDTTLQTTIKESEKLAKELQFLGVNMNLAPVVDVNINPQNPIIGALGRSFSASATEVYNNAKVFIQNHKNNNVISVEKHFPGQGSATADTHLGLADITSTYKTQELEPYEKLNKDKLLSAVMVAHVINKNIDKNYPASLSAKFLQDILRKQIGFNGVIISDDMQMSALTDNYNFDESIILAINAGVDVISISNNTSKGYDGSIAHKVRDVIFNAVKNNEISEQRIIESFDRIIKIKKQFRIIKPTIKEIKEENFELLQAEAVNFNDIYNIAKGVEQKTGTRSALLLAVSQEELNLEKTDMCYLTNFVTGDGVRQIDGKKVAKVMKPDRDISGFLSITKVLGKEPTKTLVTCPMSFGWGGAMGPADFIPSTWLKYKSKIESMTGKSADPWNVKDAFLAMGLYLADSGAKDKTQKGEWESAMIYFSGSANSGYNFYADQVMDIATKIQKDINIIEEN